MLCGGGGVTREYSSVLYAPLPSAQAAERIAGVLPIRTCSCVRRRSRYSLASTTPAAIAVALLPRPRPNGTGFCRRPLCERGRVRVETATCGLGNLAKRNTGGRTQRKGSVRRANGRLISTNLDVDVQFRQCSVRSVHLHAGQCALPDQVALACDNFISAFSFIAKFCFLLCRGS